MEVKDAPVEIDMPDAPVFSDPELSALIVVIDRLFAKGGIEGKEAHAMGALRTKLVMLLQMTDHTQKE